MASRNLLRSAMIVEPFLLSHLCKLHFNANRLLYRIPSPDHHNCDKLKHIGIRIGARKFHPPKPALSCSRNETPPSQEDDEEDPPQEAVFKAISEVSNTQGRVDQTGNMVIGGTVADDSTDEWLALDQKVNSYPSVRGFTAIGTGGEDFVKAMVVAVESVIQQPIPQGCVRQKLSSGGKYVSVNIGPIQVVSGEQVRAVYNAMRSDERMKYIL